LRRDCRYSLDQNGEMYLLIRRFRPGRQALAADR
jgi:hypothetical protein